MQLFEELDDKNFLLYAAKNYYNPTCIDAEEFFDDLKRFNYLKRLVNRYKDNDDLSERLMLNHIIIIFNVFGIEPGLKMLEFKLGLNNWYIIKPFLVFLKLIRNDQYVDVVMDPRIVEVLRQI